jgi:hypothetical protein
MSADGTARHAAAAALSLHIPKIRSNSASPHLTSLQLRLVSVQKHIPCPATCPTRVHVCRNTIAQFRSGWFSRHEIANRLNASTLVLMVGNWTVVQHGGCCSSSRHATDGRSVLVPSTNRYYIINPWATNVIHIWSTHS